MTTLKIQYDNFETGEFTEENSVDKESLLTVFDQNTEIVEVYSTYTIKQPLVKFFIRTGENYLCVMHFAKDAFTVWYCNDLDTKLFEGNFYKKSVRKILELFIDNKFDELNKFIPRTTNSENELITNFRTSDFLYTYKKRGLFGIILYSVVLLPIHYIILSSIFISHDFIIAFMMSMFPIANIFLIRLHLNYIRNSKNISIKVSSGSTKIIVFKDNNKIEFSKNEIKLLTIYNGAGSKNPFGEYSFSRIVLNDNRVFDISYMVLEPFELRKKLSKVQTTKIDKFYPYIKNYIT